MFENGFMIFFFHRANSKVFDLYPDVRSSDEALQLSNELDEQRFKIRNIPLVSPTDDIPVYGYSKINKDDQELSLPKDVGKRHHSPSYYTGNGSGTLADPGMMIL